jgi:hypothetical protein
MPPASASTGTGRRAAGMPPGEPAERAPRPRDVRAA